MAEEIPNNLAQTTNPQNQANISRPAQTPPNDLPPQKHAKLNFKNFIIIGAVVVAAITMLITGYFLFLPQQNEAPNISVNNISPTTIPAKTSTPIPENALEAPRLYPEFDWKETEPTIPSEISILYMDSESRRINLSGKEWIYTGFGMSQNTFISFSDYYSKEAEGLGWENNLNYNNQKIQAIVADGPTGSVMGYIKIVGDKARVFVIEKNAKFKGYNIYEKVEFRVFVSDIFSTSELEN